MFEMTTRSLFAAEDEFEVHASRHPRSPEQTVQRPRQRHHSGPDRISQRSGCAKEAPGNQFPGRQQDVVAQPPG